jgi:hypothetical protein
LESIDAYNSKRKEANMEIAEPTNKHPDNNTKYYLTAFKRINSGGNIIWNWGAFFFSFLWLFMRGMYWEGFCALSVWILSIPVGAIAFGAIGSMISIVLGLVGTKIYWGHVKRQINNGWHLCDHYQSKNYVCAALMFCAFLFACIYSYDANIISVICAIFVVFAIVFILFFEKNRDRKIQMESIKDYDREISEKNILIILEKHSGNAFSGSGYYDGLFQRIENGKVFEVNIPFVVFGFFWMLLHRMYKETVVWISYTFAVIFMGNALEPNGISSLLLSSADSTLYFMLVLGGINLIYYRRIKLRNNLKPTIPQRAMKKFCVVSILHFYHAV